MEPRDKTLWFESAVFRVTCNNMEHTGNGSRHPRVRWSLVATLVVLPACLLGQPTLNVRPSPIPGIDLIGPSQPEFNDIIARLVPGRDSRAALAPVLPYSVLIRNSGIRTVVSYVVCFEFARADGTKGPARIQVRDYRTSSPKLAASVSHLIAPIGGLTQAIANGRFGSVSQNEGYADEMRQFVTVTAYLDAAVYDDGEFVGPDHNGSFEQLGVTAEYARIANHLIAMRGESNDAVMAWLKQQESEVSAAEAGSSNTGYRLMLQQEVVRIKLLEDNLKRNEAEGFGLLVTAMAHDGAVPLLRRAK